MMSFRLTNAPAHFVYLMNSIFMAELDKFTMVFIADILVFSKSKKVREYPWIQARYGMCWIRGHQRLCISPAVFSDWLAIIADSSRTSPRLSNPLLVF
jgi:hypothetical protein